MFKIVKLDLLIAVYIFCIAVSEIMGMKTFSLILGPFVLNPSVAIFTLPIIFTINDIVTEVYGPERTRSIIRSGLFVIILIFLFAILATALPPSARFAATESIYDQIFTGSIRFSFASLVAFALSDFLDVFIFVRMRKALGKKGLWLRNNVSNIVSQFTDSFIFLSLAFYAFNVSFVENYIFIFSILFPYWILRCLLSIVETPFAYLGVKWLRSDEKKKNTHA